MQTPLAPRFLVTLALLALTPGLALGQTVTGRILSGGQPVAGALVVLLDAGRSQVGGVLTDEVGSFRMQAPEPGRFSLRVQRVGFEAP